MLLLTIFNEITPTQDLGLELFHYTHIIDK